VETPLSVSQPQLKDAVTMPAMRRLITTFILGAVFIAFPNCSLMSQQADPKQQIDTNRLNEVNARLRELKGLLSEYGMGHPKVQDLLRRMKLMEEEVRLEQTYVERLAAQLQKTEEELRDRQKQQWMHLNEVQEDLGAGAGGVVPSLDTIDALERDCLLELQKIEWETAAEKTMEKSKQANSLLSNQIKVDELRLKAQQLARDSIRLRLESAQKNYASEKSQRDRGQSVSGDPAELALTVQLLANELKVAETNLQAAELELTIKKEMVQNSAAEQLAKLSARRDAVQMHLSTLPKMKELARQVAQSYSSTDQISEQIRAMEAQRFQYQTKMAEQQALLDLMRQAMSPQSESKGSGKRID
jgi:hypothetical protein